MQAEERMYANSWSLLLSIIEVLRECRCCEIAVVVESVEESDEDKKGMRGRGLGSERCFQRNGVQTWCHI